MYTLLGYFVPFLTLILQKTTIAQDGNLQSCKCGLFCLKLSLLSLVASVELLSNLYANCKFAVFLWTLPTKQTKKKTVSLFVLKWIDRCLPDSKKLGSSDSIYMIGSLHGSVSLQAVGSDGAAPLVCHHMPWMQPHSPGTHSSKMLWLGVSTSSQSRGCYNEH